jgi:hypothetical protein
LRQLTVDLERAFFTFSLPGSFAALCPAHPAACNSTRRRKSTINRQMTDIKEEGPSSSSAERSQQDTTNNDVANVNSLVTLNLLHQQVPLINVICGLLKLMHLRASVNHFLYPLSKPDTHSSGNNLHLATLF